MYRNLPAVQAFLESGGTLVVPTRQRAAAVQLAYTAALLERGAQTWDSPDIIHWSAWQGRRLDLLRQPEAGARRRLTAVEEWFLWREAVVEAADAGAAPLLQADGLIEELRRADELIDAWGLHGGGGVGPGAEGALLLRLRRQLARRRDALGIVAGPLWREPPEEADARLWCLGFEELGRADRLALQSLGARIGMPREAGATASERPAPHPEGEAQQIAAWCRARLMQDPRARLLVVAPRLSQYQEALRRHLSTQLDGEAILAGDADISRFVIEGGSPLADFPLVTAARAWLQAVSGRSAFSDFSLLLRSPYVELGGLEARIALEVWLRQHHVTAIEPADCRRLAARMAGGEDDAFAATPWQRPLQVLDALQAEGPLLDTPAGWARRWAHWLEAAGWPGTRQLGSREQQVRQRFEAVLGEFACLGELSAPLPAMAALQTFQDWLRRAAFAPASGDVPVTVSGDIGDPLVQYDGIWVCGLSAQEWPPAVQANAFVSLPGLMNAGWEAGTASGALRRAESAMQAWSARAGELVYSWPEQQGDALLLPSPLLAIDPVAVAAAAAATGPAAPPPSPWQAAQPWTLEPYGMRPARPWPHGARSRGGVRLLEDQAACPFRGFALGRLQSGALEAPRPGVPDTVHGIVMHGALQRLWRELLDARGLQAAGSALPARIDAAVAAALHLAEAACVPRLPPALWQIEARRCAQLIATLLATEATREPFAVVATERMIDWQPAGVGLRLRVDRLDRLADGGQVLIDYKTGRQRGFDERASRPEAPQLLVYATALAEPLCAAAAVYVHVEGVKWVGAADRTGRVPDIKGSPDAELDWAGLMARWSAQVHGLVEEFARGDAAVTPQPHACERCHLAGLCRIDARAVPLAEDDDAAERT